MIGQSLFDGISASFLILPAALGLLIIYRTSGFIFFAYGATIATAPYIAWALSSSNRVSLTNASVLGVFGACALGIILEIGFHAPARRRGLGSFGLLLLSIGMYIVLQNSIALMWGNDVRSFRPFISRTSYEILGIYMTNVQMGILCVSVICLMGYLGLISLSKTGRRFAAVACGAELADALGMRVSAVRVTAMGCGCVLGGIAGILSALDSDMTPTMGMQPMMMGIVAVMIGGNTFCGTVLGTFLLGMTTHLGVVWIPAQWQSAITFLVLIVYLSLPKRIVVRSEK